MVYSGMPSHYPHWSYGKSFEKLKTLYDYGVSGLPYEMVINSNPSIAYLMRDNSLALQVLTIAHVYGHNDFFKNNFTFRSTRAEYTDRKLSKATPTGCATMSKIRASAWNASRRFSTPPMRCRCNAGATSRCSKPTAAEERQRKIEEAKLPDDPFHAIHRRREVAEPDLQKVPLYPDQDLLLFIRDHNPLLAEWEKDLLTIVHEEAQYFIPQIETKIMNEGWASFWHKRILETLDLPQGLHLEIHRAPHPGAAARARAASIPIMSA